MIRRKISDDSFLSTCTISQEQRMTSRSDQECYYHNVASTSLTNSNDTGGIEAFEQMSLFS